MAKTVQNVVDAATAQDLSLDGDLLVQDTAEIIGKVNDFVNEMFTKLAAYVGYYYAAKTTITSTTGSSARTLDLTNASTITVFRLRKVEINSSGSQVFLVPEIAQAVQPSPRAFQRGQTLHEVGSEWGATGTVNIDVIYARGPVQLDESGAFSQSVDLPERWTHPLELKLTGYLVRKDGRPQEAAAWDEYAGAALEALTAYLVVLHGEGEPE